MPQDYGFAPVLTLVRVPRTRIFNSIIKSELETTYRTKLYPAFVRYMNTILLQGWKELPTYNYKDSVRASRISIYISVDLNTRMGKIFNWSDKGTGLEGPSKSTYPIDAVNADTLIFDVPYQPMTMPLMPLRYNPSAENRTVSAPHIDHPGIQARGFSDRANKHFKDRRNTSGFYRLTENAYRRAIRRWQKMGSKPV